MSRVFWDTNLFIYLFEGSGGPAARVREIRERMIERGDQLVTSTMTVAEILVRPVGLGRTDDVERYERLFSSPAVQVVAFDRHCARIYADVRRDEKIRPPDAIQLSCAARSRCDLFITNDERLSRKAVAGIHFIVSLERAFL